MTSWIASPEWFPSKDWQAGVHLLNLCQFPFGDGDFKNCVIKNCLLCQQVLPVQPEVFIHKMGSEADIGVLRARRPDIRSGRHPHITEIGQLLDHLG